MGLFYKSKLNDLLIKLNEIESELQYVDYSGSPTISEEVAQKAKELNLDEKIIKEYTKKSNGRKIKWWKDSSKGIGGEINLNEIKWLLIESESMVDELSVNDFLDPDLKNFRILDNPTMNSQVGFFMNSKEIDFNKRLYFRMSGENASDLDLDFKGYLEMALESKVFFYWQKVLVDIQDNEESNEVLTFKEHMPKIFEDFSWDAFVEKYESLRLSNQE